MFKNYVYAQSIVIGATFNMDESACDPELLGTVRGLLLKSNADEIQYHNLDRYIIPYFLSCTSADILRTLKWDSFVLRDEHVFKAHHLVDIGRNIRQIILGDLQTDAFTRQVFFSMPYLKHNRLNLPPLHETKFQDLQNCVRIMYASCLGMLQRNSKKPPWTMRVQFHMFTHQLLLNATHQDLHIFFKHHLVILWISLIEYVIFFIRHNMCMEHHIFEEIFSVDGRNSLQFDEIACLINNFRIHAYDDTLFHTTRLNRKALLALERCNRMCSCKMNPSNILRNTDDTAHDIGTIPDNFRFAFNIPKINSPLLLHIMHAQRSFQEVTYISAIQKSVCVYPLPSILYRKQMQAVQSIYRSSSFQAIYTTRCDVPDVQCRLVTNNLGAANATCQMCSAGSYNSQLDATTCSKCGAGYKSSSPGAVSQEQCTACAVNTYSVSGAAQCDLTRDILEIITLAWDVLSAPLCHSYFQRSKCFDFSCFLAESVSDCVGP
jgi:hypothetical protein